MALAVLGSGDEEQIGFPIKDASNKNETEHDTTKVPSLCVGSLILFWIGDGIEVDKQHNQTTKEKYPKKDCHGFVSFLGYE